MYAIAVFAIISLSMKMSEVEGHGRLIDPPSRASAWRYGFATPPDYTDDEGSCGGYTPQYILNRGACGICGDRFDVIPRPHEYGGMYATGTIVKQYSKGQEITAVVELTTNHRGHFEFRICPLSSSAVEATQTCLNRNPLPLSNGSGYGYSSNDLRGKHYVFLQLPSNLTCDHCVLQWVYRAGNSWGICGDGKGGMGCGLQEEFRACADVAILG